MTTKQRLLTQPTLTVGASKSEAHISLPTESDQLHAVVSFSAITEAAGITIQPKHSYDNGATYLPYGASQSPSVKTAVSAGVLMPVETTVPGTAEADEVQVVTPSATATGGTFVIYWNGGYTTALAYNASASTIQTAFRLISDAACTVEGGMDTALTITFLGELAKLNQPAVQITNNYLYVAASTKVAVATGIWEISSHGFVHNQRVLVSTAGVLPPELTAGSYYIRYITANTFTLATTQTGAAITSYTSPGQGTHSVVAADYEFLPAGTNYPTQIFSPHIITISTGAGDSCTVSGVYVAE